MKLSDEALDAAITAFLNHGDQVIPGALSCDCGLQVRGATIGAQQAARLMMRHQMQAIVDALTPHLRDQGVVREEWRVSGDPGPGYPPYSFVWPRPGQNEGGEERARAFYNLVTDNWHIRWDDGPYLHHRTIYTETGPWLLAEEAK